MTYGSRLQPWSEVGYLCMPVQMHFMGPGWAKNNVLLQRYVNLCFRIFNYKSNFIPLKQEACLNQ